jgi:hypothetical protein
VRLTALNVIALVAFGAGWAVAAGSPLLDLASAALRRAEATNLDEWAFTVTTVAGSRKTIERHDPTAAAGQRWELLLKDGQVPSERQRRKHADGRRWLGRSQKVLRSLVDPETLRVVGEDAARVTFDFGLKAENAEVRQMTAKVRGALVVRREDAALETLDLTATDRISKAGVWTISELSARLCLRRPADRPETLLESITVRIRGRALLVKSLDVDVVVTFSDYRWIGRPAGG